MSPATIIAGTVVALLGAVIILWTKRRRERDEMQRYSVTPEALHSWLNSEQRVLVFDVRQPLDLLAYPEIIPGARRIHPDNVLAKPSSLIPHDKDAVVYCTCPGDKTSRAVMLQARSVQLNRVKFLEGGLAAWKAKGYPVEPYRETFHLYPAAATPES
jgi:rhodanese-related sulfurtransferase